MEAHKIKISIVIINWNGKKWLEDFLPKIQEYSSDDVVTVVVDNKSTDDSISFIKNNYPKIKIIENDSNYGYAKGYNLSLKKIESKYYILLNSDIEVTKNWIEPIIKLMDEDEKIAACQPKILDFYNRNKFEYAGGSGGFIDKFGYPLCRGRIFDDIEIDSYQYEDAREIFWASGACLFIRASKFWEVNGFDNDFFAHQEEIDLCWRLKNNGYKIMVEPNSIVYHVGGGTLKVGSPLKTYLNFRNNLCTIFKNSSFKSLIFIIPTRLILDGLASIVFIFKSNGIKHFYSIFRSHIYFYMNLPKLIIKRKRLNQKEILEGKLNSSIIYKNKILKIKKFSEL
tara:strand:+ start:4512 stop:5531 length:1020 start_codon:yes stop_codon:yes gene_type:complete